MCVVVGDRRQTEYRTCLFTRKSASLNEFKINGTPCVGMDGMRKDGIWDGMKWIEFVVRGIVVIIAVETIV